MIQWYPYDTAPGHISGQTIIQKQTWTPMFIAVLFKTAKAWKQPECILTENG